MYGPNRYDRASYERYMTRAARVTPNYAGRLLPEGPLPTSPVSQGVPVMPEHCLGGCAEDWQSEAASLYGRKTRGDYYVYKNPNPSSTMVRRVMREAWDNHATSRRAREFIGFLSAWCSDQVAQVKTTLENLPCFK